MHRRNFLGVGVAGAFARAGWAKTKQSDPPAGKVRNYFVAADEFEWDYAPSGINQYTGKPFEGYAKTFVENGPHLIGRAFRKAVYREYTDDSFKQLKSRPAGDAYLGMLGPILHAEVGDTIRVTFKNNSSQHYSMHPHGVFYAKDSEGAPYNDGVPMDQKPGAAVPPGKTYVYTWPVPERAGPGPNDPSSLGWAYHSHVNELKDVNSGLNGMIVVTRRGMADAKGRPKDVDREVFTLFLMYDENQSWYLDHNIKTYCGDPAGVDKLDYVNRDTEGRYNFGGVGFAAANFKSAINGYVYANMPMVSIKKGERVRWYVGSMGEFANFHTPHWHGNVVIDHGRRVDVIILGPSQTATVDMLPDNPGVWLYHCHVSDHMEMGMMARYQVLA